MVITAKVTNKIAGTKNGDRKMANQPKLTIKKVLVKVATASKAKAYFNQLIKYAKFSKI